MISRIIPWKLFLQRAAHHYGFIDPVGVMARMRKFSQPSEIQEPLELLRAGVSFHARGLLNTKAIQTNLDWIWPFWVHRQFTPGDPSFIPRAFSFSHVNLTHRNWTAVGHPQIPLYPIIDPRGLVTPLYDGWSIDFWLKTTEGHWLLPSRLDSMQQELLFTPNLAVLTSARSDTFSLTESVSLSIDRGRPTLEITVNAHSQSGGKLIVTVRPYNPEGIQFIEEAGYEGHLNCLVINKETLVTMDKQPNQVHFSNYEHGDVMHCLEEAPGPMAIKCPAGMVTVAATFLLPADGSRHTLQLSVPLQDELKKEVSHPPDIKLNWAEVVRETATLDIPNKDFQFLYDAAVRTLLLLSAKQIVPGPYTYFRFWFRDACLMINALLALGLHERVLGLLKQFPERQKHSGYFQSQEGEWDSNGQVLWIFDRYERLTGQLLPHDLFKTVASAAAWINRKRLPEQVYSLHAGLLPPGFSAEHFGPNDYYYWDDFWAIAGLQGAARMHRRRSHHPAADSLEQQARQLEIAVSRSIDLLPPRRAQGGIPASPYRRMDSGAIGSLVADYPLHLVTADDARIQTTTNFLLDNCFYQGAFFQDMIHSGVNVYLTLDIAQTLLRRGDERYRDLLRRVAALATTTGQWPEAIHPATGGGCMGDGQHGWAAAEWIMIMRHLFVREESDHLVIGSGIFPEWLATGKAQNFGPTPTPFGPVSVHIAGKPGEKHISIQGSWFTKPPPMIVSVPGTQTIMLHDSVIHQRLQSAQENQL
jgi:hypothetical protein